MRKRIQGSSLVSLWAMVNRIAYENVSLLHAQDEIWKEHKRFLHRRRALLLFIVVAFFLQYVLHRTWREQSVSMRKSLLLPRFLGISPISRVFCRRVQKTICTHSARFESIFDIFSSFDLDEHSSSSSTHVQKMCHGLLLNLHSGLSEVHHPETQTFYSCYFKYTGVSWTSTMIVEGHGHFQVRVDM